MENHTVFHFGCIDIDFGMYEPSTKTLNLSKE